MNVLRVIYGASRAPYALVTKSTSNCSFCLQRPSVTLLQLNRRCFASKKNEAFSGELPPETAKKEPKFRGKTTPKDNIYLKDLSGRMLGLKTRQEAQLIAQKNRLVLIEDDATKKIPTLKLANPIDLLKDDKRADSSFSSSDSISDSESGATDTDSKKKHRAPPKQLIFSSKLSEHDLQTKIKQAKKWVSKGQETIIKVTANNDRAKLNVINKVFDEAFNKPALGTKINQHRISDKELKFNIVPFDLKLAAQLDLHGESHSDSAAPNLDQLDPNQLLNDENILSSIPDDLLIKKKK